MSQIGEDLSNSYEVSPDRQRAIYQQSSTVEGKTPLRIYSKEDLVSVHFTNIGLLNSSNPLIKEFVLPAAYSPSDSPLDALQKISFAELKLETHHRGCFVTAKTITPPYQSTVVITVLEEEGGNVARLVLGFQDDSLGVSGTSLPINSTVAIKEPYCKFDGEGHLVICVNHPSDIAILRGDDPAVSLIMQFVSEGKKISPLQWKNAGDKAYLEKNYASAIECYTQAIENAPPEEPVFARDVYRKRAFANLTSKFFIAAKSDALASCSGNNTDEKTLYCAGRAAYGLGQYGEGKTHFQKALELNPRDVKCKKDLNCTVSRIREEEEGAYDFKSMVTSVTKGDIRLDHADFLKNTKIGPTESHGRGLFATRDLEAGSLVLCEKAFALPDLYWGDQPNNFVMYNFNTNSRTQRPAQAALLLELVQKLYHNPHLNQSFFDLDGSDYLRSGKEGELVDGVPIVDTFLVEAIRLTNCFSSPRMSLDLLKTQLTSSESFLTTGLWRRAAYINHSCVPNCVRSFIGDMMIIRATCDIPAGTEVTHQYMAPDVQYSVRRDGFVTHWKFECDCRLCSGEKKSLDSAHRKRSELFDKVRKEALKSPANMRVPSATIKHVERLTKKLEDLHEPETYRNLPRLQLVHPTIWLTDAYRWSQNSIKTVTYALEVLRNFGFFPEIKDGKLRLNHETGIANSEAFNMLRYAAAGYQALGKMDLAGQCEDTARKMFVALTGSEEGLDEFFESQK